MIKANYWDAPTSYSKETPEVETWHVFAAKVAAGQSKRAAGLEMGWSESTAHRVGKEPKVNVLINRLRLEAYQEITDKMRQAMPAAIEKLIEQIGSDNEKIAQGACRILIDQHVRLKDSSIEALNKAVSAEERHQMIKLWLSQALGDANAEAMMDRYLGQVFSSLQAKLGEKFGEEHVREVFGDVAIEAQESAVLDVGAVSKKQ